MSKSPKISQYPWRVKIIGCQHWIYVSENPPSDMKFQLAASYHRAPSDGRRVGFHTPGTNFGTIKHIEANPHYTGRVDIY